MARKNTIRGSIQSELHDIRKIHAKIRSLGVTIDIRDEIMNINRSIKHDDLEGLKETLRNVKRLYDTLVEYHVDVLNNLNEQSNLLTNFGSGEVERIKTLEFKPEHAIVSPIPDGEIDPITLDAIGNYFFMCTNEKKKCYYNAENYVNYCNYSRTNARHGVKCPVCRNPMNFETYCREL